MRQRSAFPLQHPLGKSSVCNSLSNQIDQPSKGEHLMRKSKALVVATTFAFLLAAAPMNAAPRFTRDVDPIGRFVKLVKKFFGISVDSEVSGPPPAPTNVP